MGTQWGPEPTPTPRVTTTVAKIPPELSEVRGLGPTVQILRLKETPKNPKNSAIRVGGNEAQETFGVTPVTNTFARGEEPATPRHYPVSRPNPWRWAHRTGTVPALFIPLRELLSDGGYVLTCHVYFFSLQG